MKSVAIVIDLFLLKIYSNARKNRSSEKMQGVENTEISSVLPT
jgi:hypothetical protein